MRELRGAWQHAGWARRPCRLQAVGVQGRGGAPVPWAKAQLDVSSLVSAYGAGGRRREVDDKSYDACASKWKQIRGPRQGKIVNADARL
jgi:hypothetical protein